MPAKKTVASKKNTKEPKNSRKKSTNLKSKGSSGNKKNLKKSSFKWLILIDYQRLFNEFLDFNFINYIKNAII